MDDGRRRRVLALVLDETATRGGGYWWRPRGFSMRPVIEDGERVLIQPVDPARLRVGDIVKFSDGAALLMHRVVRRTVTGGAATFLLCGDNTTAVDSPIDGAQVIGIAVAVERAGHIVRLDTRAARCAWRLRRLRAASTASMRRLAARVASLGRHRWTG